MAVFEAVSFHIVKPCNMKCKFCYATFDDMHVQQMSFEDAQICIDKLIDAGVTKITFAGGEPLLYKHIKQVIVYAKKKGITTSIISNGSLLTDHWLSEMLPYLDWVGISIDSLNRDTNISIGRTTLKNPDYRRLIGSVNLLGYKLKINTVVNRYNHNEDFKNFIAWANPDRWKVFQTLRIEGQNETQFDEIKCSDKDFYNFIDRHNGIDALVPEDNEAMTGSYLLIDPQGRLFENSKGKHTYSDSLISNEMEHCLGQIELNRETFIARGGIYNW